MTSPDSLRGRSEDNSCLIGTALPALWPAQGSLVFLGAWCTRYADRHLLSGRTYQVLPYHWDDGAQLVRDMHALTEAYETLMPLLATTLDYLHNECHSERYWRIVCGWWLRRYLQVLFDKWSILSAASTQHPNAPLVAHPELDTHVVAADMAEFTHQVATDVWNQYFFQQVAAQIGSPKLRYVNAPLHETHCSIVHSPGPRRLRGRIYQVLQKTRAAREAHIAWDGDALSLRQKVELLASPNRVAFTQTVVADVDKSVNPERRQWTLAQTSLNGFIQLAGRMIPMHLPKAYLETYAEIGKLAEAQAWPRKPRLMITANGFAENEVWKRYAASRVEKGTSRLVISQHGGHYGVARFSSIWDHEIDICDNYLSWGWRDPTSPKVLPSVAPRLEHMPLHRPSGQKSCLLIGAGFPRYAHWLGSHPIASQFGRVIEDQISFVSSLDNSVKDKLVVRPYPHDYGWGEREHLAETHPDVRIADHLAPMPRLMSDARLCVIIQNSTALLECLARGYPTVVFWRSDLWEISSEASPYFDALAGVGVFFDDPKDCAAHVNQIFEDVEVWWMRPEVSSAVTLFVDRFAHTGEKTIKQLLSDALATEDST